MPDRMSHSLWNPSKEVNLEANPRTSSTNSRSTSLSPIQLDDNEGIPLESLTSQSDLDLDSDEEMMDRRTPILHRPTDGKSNEPLLGRDIERGRLSYDTHATESRPPIVTRRSNLRSRSPGIQAKQAERQKYIYAAFFLLLSLISFTVQTETAVYIQHELKWNKAYCML